MPTPRALSMMVIFEISNPSVENASKKPMSMTGIIF
jgi:hypothetical protein